ncbi:AAA family ATPase [soil metagenome]
MDDEVLHIDLLGNFRLSLGEEQVNSVNKPRVQALLAYLILNRRSPLSRQYVSFLFYPDTSEKQAQTNLRQLLHHLKTSLPDCTKLININHKNLQWKTDCPCTIDVDEFENAISDAKREINNNNSYNLIQILDTAVDLYKGELMPNCYDDWIFRERERLRDDFIWALELLMHLFEEDGDYQAAVKCAHRLLQEDELRESVYSILMRLHALQNDRASALRIFHKCTTILNQELGIKPGAEVQGVYKQIINDRAIESSLVSHSAVLIDESPLVGRIIEWEMLLHAWQLALTGNSHLVIVEGEPGIGKSRLCQEMLQRVKAQGAITAHARSYAAAGRLSYGPVKKWLENDGFSRRFSGMKEVWLTELAHLLPELLVKYPNLPHPGPLKENWQRQKFFEAISRAILDEDSPTLLVLDDLQWCDTETLDWLLYLLRFKNESKLLIVCSLRNSELPENNPLLTFLSALKQENKLTEIILAPLNENETALLAAQISGIKLQEEGVKKLFKETEGNPLFIVESLREGIMEKIIPSNIPTIFPKLNFPDRPLMPRKVFEIFIARLNQLSSSARELIEIASAIGREFTFRVLALASHFQDAQLVRALDELWHRRIIREQGADAYDFSHDKLREIAYSNMSAAKRHRMHLLVARAFEELKGSFTQDISGVLAFHYDQAGQQLKAIPFYKKAAEGAIRIYANQEAVLFLEKALNFLTLLPKDRKRDELELELQTALGQTLVPLKGYGAIEIHGICERIQTLSHQLKIIPSAPVLRTMAIGKLTSGETLQALIIGEQLLALAQKNNDPVLLVEGHYAVGVVNFWLGNLQLSKKHLEQAISSYNPERQTIHTLNFAQNPHFICLVRLSLTLWYLGYQKQALQKCEEAVILAKKASHPFSLAYTLHYASWVADNSGNFKLSYRLIEDTLALSEEQEFNFWILTSNIQKGRIMVEEGSIRQGIKYIRQSMNNYAETGMRLGWPYYCTLLAQAYEKNNEFDKGIDTIDEGLLIGSKCQTSFYDAELLRYKGILLWKGGAGKNEAEICLKKALKISQNQQAKTFELKTMKDLYRLWQVDGNTKEAKLQLQDVYNWFTEGHEFQDLLAAKTIIQSIV